MRKTAGLWFVFFIFFAACVAAVAISRQSTQMNKAFAAEKQKAAMTEESKLNNHQSGHIFPAE